MGTSSLIAQLSICIPLIMVRKFIGMACGNEQEEFANSMSGFRAAIRIVNLTHSIFNAITQSFIPVASYSFAAKRYSLLKLTLHIYWLALVWGTLTLIITWSFPKTLSKMFSNGKMVLINNGLAPFAGFKFIAISLLQAIQQVPRATILSFLSNFGSFIVLVLILYYTNKHDGARIIWCYPLSYFSSTIISIFFLWTPVKNLIRLSKEEDMEVAFRKKN